MYVYLFYMYIPIWQWYTLEFMLALWFVDIGILGVLHPYIAKHPLTRKFCVRGVTVT